MLVTILVDTELLDQKNSKKLHPSVRKQINDKFIELDECEKQGKAFVDGFLKKYHGIKFKGVTNNGDIDLFKFEVNAGDRIIYTYGKNLPSVPKEHENSIVLIEYKTHDDQERGSKRFDHTANRKFSDLKDTINTPSKVNEIPNEPDSIEECYYIPANLLSEDHFKAYVFEDDDFAQYSPEEIDKYLLLSEEQKEIVQQIGKPSIIMGGAGTGKTIVALHSLIAFDELNENTRCAYFTQSEPLRKKAEDCLFGNDSEIIKKPKNEIKFLDVNTFCLDRLGLYKKDFVRTDQFVEFYSDVILNDLELSRKCKKNRLSVMEIWTEIRGTLKGAMDGNWSKTRPQHQDGYKPLKDIEKYVSWSGEKRTFVLNDTVENIRNRAKNDEKLSDNGKQLLDKALHYFSSFDPQARVMSKNNYINRSDELSIINRQQREFVYEICEKYEEYLAKNKKYDENDLIRFMFEQKKLIEEEKFDMVVVDEVQDYTELQIFLIYKLCRTTNNILFAGDVHQIINPTLFDESRLLSLYKSNAPEKKYLRNYYAPVKFYLRKNYRCPGNVVELSNRISELRRRVIGNQTKESELPDKSSVSETLIKPCRIEYSPDTAETVLKAAIKQASMAVLVPDEKTKKKLIEIVGKEELPIIFTVAEIKGMEFKHVVCYNLIGAFADEWEKILGENHEARRSTRCRYYFNLIYVAVTRSQANVCFIDQKTVPKLEDQLSLEKVDEFEYEMVGFEQQEASAEDRYNDAQKFEAGNHYEEALNLYKKAKNMGIEKSDIDKKIYSCQAKLHENKNEFDQAILYHMLCDNLDSIKYCRKEIENPEIATIADFFISDNPKIHGLSHLIERCYGNDKFSNRERDLVFLLAINKAKKILSDMLNNNYFKEVV